MTHFKKSLIALALLAWSAHSQAGLFDDNVARQQVIDLTNKVQTLQQQNQMRIDQLEAGNKQILNLVRQIELQKDELAKLNGQNEVLQFNLNEAIQRQKDLYIDLDNRLRAIEQGKAEIKAGQQANEQGSFDAAVALVQAKKFKEASAALNKFATEFPKSDKLPAAQYWLGTSYAMSKDYKSATTAFKNVVENAPTDPKAADALLGLASVAAAMNDKKTSRNYLITIIEQYPQSDAAVRAKKALMAPN
ncbi:tol-pal system protein YbgF [Deefgea piscis]|uniref:Cell division coordinator CpoB n=1 Tax=Deefgea piscis TaxID=2739061 RepID=A0A6M8SRX8_9NEIS|nr:tol-pal system protein YbgF [Deefgea piscis]QKJ66210.1 tol-pal system protein YbgF [Deefgea piscis]